MARCVQILKNLFKRSITLRFLQCSFQHLSHQNLGTTYLDPFISLKFLVLISLTTNEKKSTRDSVHSHAAAALINFCEGVEHDTLIPYLDPIVERLLKLLHSSGGNASSNTSSSGNGVSRGGAHGFGYVQEQVVTTLAMVADASEATFAKVCVHYVDRDSFLICSVTSRVVGPRDLTALFVNNATTFECSPTCEWCGAQETQMEGHGMRWSDW